MSWQENVTANSTKQQNRTVKFLTKNFFGTNRNEKRSSEKLQFPTSHHWTVSYISATKDEMEYIIQKPRPQFQLNTLPTAIIVWPVAINVYQKRKPVTTHFNSSPSQQDLSSMEHIFHWILHRHHFNSTSTNSAWNSLFIPSAIAARLPPPATSLPPTPKSVVITIPSSSSPWNVILN